MGDMTVGERDLDIRPDWPLGPRLRAAREDAGFSQRGAAKAAGMSVTTWSAIETGTRKVGGGEIVNAKPTAENVMRAASAVGISPGEALRLAGIDQGVSFQERRGRPSIAEAELTRKVARLTEIQRQAVNEIIDAMLYPHGQGHATIESGPAEFAGAGVQSALAETAAGVLVRDEDDPVSESSH
jgi:transcriptional regulator with XRE-family HTH domain